jgi:hypothetical protein
VPSRNEEWTEIDALSRSAIDPKSLFPESLQTIFGLTHLSSLRKRVVREEKQATVFLNSAGIDLVSMINKAMSRGEQEYIFDTAEAYIRNHSAMVIQAREGQKTKIGSAVCIELGARLFLATVAHNFDLVERGWKVFFYAGQKNFYPPLKTLAHNDAHFVMDKELDLGWVELDTASAAQSHIQGLPLSSLDPYHTIQDTLSYTIAGFPAERIELKEIDGAMYRVGEAVLYVTIPVQPNAANDELFFDYPDDAISFDGPSVPHPGGFSGGGVWATPIKAPSKDWTPNFPVVAIAKSYCEELRRIRSLSISQWLEFLAETCPELEHRISPLLDQALCSKPSVD